MTPGNKRGLEFNPASSPFADSVPGVNDALGDLDPKWSGMENTQSALLNILEDFDAEKVRLQNAQRALLNILEDFDIEKNKVQEANVMLQAKSQELNNSNEELQSARDTLEQRVIERTAELRQRSLELESANRELAVSNKELESFSYSVSHDLRSPLRSMDGFSLALMEDYGDKLDGQAREYLGYIRSSSQMMARLIDDLLNLARITRQEISYEKVDLSELASEAVSDLKKANPERNLDFVVQPGLEAYGDRRLLKLVFDNLLGNALKFTAKRAEAIIEFGVVEFDGKPAYVVRDNGVGFDMTYVDKLFKPFQRLHRAEDFPGTGIGLASVHRIISRLGGRVWAESKVNEWAAFYFTLRQS